MLLTNELIVGTYEKYNTEDGPDGWGIIAKVIHELLPRTEYDTDASYFFHVKEVWNICQEYINSTYETATS